MSRPATPSDNASGERVMQTLKREEIDANRYRDLEPLRRNIEGFIDQYDNRARLHSARGACPPEEVEHAVAPVNPIGAASRQFFQPAEGAAPQGMKRMRKNIRPTRVCSFGCLTGGVHPTFVCSSCPAIPTEESPSS